MKSLRTKNLSGISIFVASTLAALLIAEVVVGYVRYQQVFTHQLASIDVITSAIDKYSAPAPDLSRPVASDSIASHRGGITNQDVPKAQNPFSSYDATIGSYRVHPFIGFSGAYSRAGPFQADYFGFRNKDSSVYFNEGADFLVVLTGGSEAVGWTHKVPISERRETLLLESPEFQGTDVRVLNLAMNSYVLAHELSVFVHLAYNLRPNVVISHTGFNDAHAAPMVPYGFKRLGLNYPGQIEDWLPRLYELKAESLHKPFVKQEGLELVADAFVQNLRKYREVAQASGAYFIAGAQAYKMDLPPGMPNDNHTAATANLLDSIEKKIAPLPWVENFMIRSAEYELEDSVHTAESAAEKIAREYFEIIMKGVADGSIRTERLSSTTR